MNGGALETLERLQWLTAARQNEALAGSKAQFGFVGRGGPTPSAHNVRQVHGALVVPTSPQTAPDCADRQAADGVYTTESKTVVAVRTADCLPVLLTDQKGRVAAAVHAGWRGLTRGILAAAVEQLTGFAETDSLMAVIGPAISRERFEVGPEVVTALFGTALGFTAEQGAWACAKGKGDRWHVDLQVAAAFALVNQGIKPQRIAVLQTCTASTVDQWFSYRAEGACLGSNWAWISLP